MDTCQQCGSGVNVIKPECATCGTPIRRPQAAPASTDLSPAWRARFELIDKAGGASLPGLKSLSMGERFKLMNWWALFFGAFYYIAKGMWRKGIALAVVLVLASMVVSLIIDMLALPIYSDGLTTGASAALFSLRANIDYYKKIVLGQNGWW